MRILTEAVETLRGMLEGSGLEEGIVALKRSPDAPRCQYERGVCITAHFGGGHGQVMTHAPLQASTRISCMYGASLQSAEERSAALAIINAASGFLTVSRKLHACQMEEYAACLSKLREMLGDSRIALIGDAAVLPHELRSHLVPAPEGAEVILVVSDGIIASSTTKLTDRWIGKKKDDIFGPFLLGYVCAPESGALVPVRKVKYSYLLSPYNP
jgi:hypothetical protein